MRYININYIKITNGFILKRHSGNYIDIMAKRRIKSKKKKIITEQILLKKLPKYNDYSELSSKFFRKIKTLVLATNIKNKKNRSRHSTRIELR